MLDNGGHGMVRVFVAILFVFFLYSGAPKPAVKKEVAEPAVENGDPAVEKAVTKPDRPITYWTWKLQQQLMRY